MDSESDKQVSNRPGLFKKGQSGNPNGRPKGKSLKEYSREMLAAMSDEERQEFMMDLPKETIWKMAEGNPHSTEDSSVTVILPKPILDNVHSNISNKEGDEPSKEN